MATLLYDGRCGICTLAVDWVERSLTMRPECLPSQSVVASDFGLSESELRERVWLQVNGRLFGGHEAIAVLGVLQPEWRWRLLGNILRTPPFSWLARAGYAVVAANRHRIPVRGQRCDLPPR